MRLSKLRSLALVLLLVTAGSFLLTNLLPGSPAIAILGPAATPESIVEVERVLHLDRPVPERYVRWLGRTVRGDLGVSYRTGEQVRPLLGRALGVTAEVVLLAELVGLLLGVPLAMWAAHRVGRRADKTISALSFGAIAAPQFAIAIVLLLVFAVRLHWFPAVGYVAPGDDLVANLRSMVLPAATLGLPLAAQYARVLRADLVAVLRQDHVRLARAMGLPSRRILSRHALRQASPTLVTVMGLQLGMLLGGSLIVESIFAVPGMGRLMVERITSRDYTVVQGGVLAIAAVYVLSNFVVDVVHGLLDPRVRQASVSSAAPSPVASDL